MVKEHLDHGDFGKWIDAEFGMTDRSARNFMQVALRLGDKSEIVSVLQPTVLYALAAPSTPDKVVEKVLQRAADGESISKKAIVEMKREFGGSAPKRGLTHDVK